MLPQDLTQLLLLRILNWHGRKGRKKLKSWTSPGSVRSRCPCVSIPWYSLEIRIKAFICKTLKLGYLPKVCKTHDLSDLIIFTGLLEELEDPNNQTVRRNWDVLVDFSKSE